MVTYLKKYLSTHFPDFVGTYYSYRIAREMNKHKLVQTPYGFKLKGNKAMQDGTFEPEESEIISSALRDANVFVDVGANIGFFTCMARSLEKHVVAVEPLAQNLGFLYHNLAANNWDDIEVFPLGLAARPGLAVLYGGSTGASLLEKWSGTSGALKRTIPLSTLDIVLGDRFNGQKIMIKIDVEGAEYDLLKGAIHTLALSPSPVWLLEICLTEHHPAGLNPNFSKIFEVFWANGYKARTIGRDGKTVTPGDVSRWVENRSRDFGYVSYLFEKE